MKERFEPTNIDEVQEVLKQHFNGFHDDYVAGIEITFENYKRINEDGESIGIRDADKTVILTVNTKPYGKQHKRFVRVEFQNVKSFEILSSAEDSGPNWGILDTVILDDGLDMKWYFDFIWGGSEFIVTCSKIIFHK